MEKFKPGTIVYQKASRVRGVVIAINPDGTIRVQDEKDEIKDYSPYVLETQDEVDARDQNTIAQIPDDSDLMY